MNRKKVLLIEDSPDIRENTTELLELEGYIVMACVNGREGLAALKESIPDLILCDVRMPVMDGYELLTEAKKDSVFLTIPFVLMSAFVERTDIDYAVKLGADAYLPKPFHTDELLKVIGRFIG
ncbi:MAG: response regulator [Bacteroidota bacterium]